MKYDWVSFIGAVIIWAFLGFRGKLSDVEKKIQILSTNTINTHWSLNILFIFNRKIISK